MNSHLKIVVSSDQSVRSHRRWPCAVLGPALWLAGAALATGLAGCGQKGPLTLPTPQAAPAAASASTPNTPARTPQ